MIPDSDSRTAKSFTMASVPFPAVRNPENDPFGVDPLQSTLLYHQSSTVSSFPSLESFSIGVFGFATLLSVSIVRKRLRYISLGRVLTRAIVLAKRYTVDPGARSHQSSSTHISAVAVVFHEVVTFDTL
jgi:hypothetical protein